jgi:hypothetical protein
MERLEKLNEHFQTKHALQIHDCIFHFDLHNLAVGVFLHSPQSWHDQNCFCLINFEIIESFLFKIFFTSFNVTLSKNCVHE